MCRSWQGFTGSIIRSSTGVREVYEQLEQKVKASGAQKPDLRDEFLLLRGITGHYTVPDDVCESYEAVYRLLAELDKAYES